MDISVCDYLIFDAWTLVEVDAGDIAEERGCTGAITTIVAALY
jgi:hypothetical protein